MIEKVGQPITFYFWFTSSKVGLTGLTPAVAVYRPDGTGGGSGAATEVGAGLYCYTVANPGSAGGWSAVATTSNTAADMQAVPALWIVGTSWVGFLDASVAGVAAAVWDALLSATRAAGSYGAKLKAWALGTDNRALVSADVHAAGATVAAVAGLAPAAIASAVWADADPTDLAVPGTPGAILAAVPALDNGTVDASVFTPTTAAFNATGALSALPAAYAGGSFAYTVRFTSGALAGLSYLIASYGVGGGQSSFTLADAMLVAPADGDTFLVLGYVRTGP
jgi:hypothetical protein